MTKQQGLRPLIPLPQLRIRASSYVGLLPMSQDLFSLLQVPQLMKEDPQDLMKGVLNGSYPIPPRIQLSIFPCLNLGLPLGLFMLFFLALDATDLTLLQPMRLPT